MPLEASVRHPSAVLVSTATESSEKASRRWWATVRSGSADAVAPTSRTRVSASARARAASAERLATVATNHDTTAPTVTNTTSETTLSRSLIVQLCSGGKKNQLAYSDEVMAVTNAGPVPPSAAAPTTTNRKNSKIDGRPTWSRTWLSTSVKQRRARDGQCPREPATPGRQRSPSVR